jgi:flagellar protein FlaG
MEPTMHIKQAGMGNYINQTETAGPGVEATAQSGQTEGAGTGSNLAPIPAREAISCLMAQNPAQLDRSVMEFTIDPGSGKQVVNIMDSASHELLRQIPMEEVLALVKSLEQLKGLLLFAEA